MIVLFPLLLIWLSSCRGDDSVVGNDIVDIDDEIKDLCPLCFCNINIDSFNMVLSSMLVKNYDAWLQTYTRLKGPEVLSYLSTVSASQILYLQDYSYFLIENNNTKTSKVETVNATFYELIYLVDSGASYLSYQLHSKGEGKLNYFP